MTRTTIKTRSECNGPLPGDRGEGFLFTPQTQSVICATHRNLVGMVDQRQFRADLFYRLSALGLAIPLVIAISTSLAARNGLLVKDRLALERARDLDVVIFDKTGTLTRGAPVLSRVAVVKGVDEGEMLGLASAVEADSEHPIAKAIVIGAGRRGVGPQPTVNFEALPGTWGARDCERTECGGRRPEAPGRHAGRHSARTR